MRYDFDRIVDRRGSGASKYDAMASQGFPEGTIPMWVADMDFLSPPCVIEALQKRLDHGMFGYSDAGAPYIEALHGWYKRRFDWEIQGDWVVKIAGVVFALHVLIEALSQPGDAVLVQQPVYMPFFHAVEHRSRTLVVNQLIEKDGAYSLDLEDFERKIKEHNVKLFILCNPQNPIARVWTKQELTAMGELCIRNGVTVIADEIHADFIYPGQQHTVFASICQEFAQNSVTCAAPSKTFNLAGLQTSNLFIPNEQLRERVRATMGGMGIGSPNLLGQIACQAAYQQGDDWVDQLVEYLWGNIALLSESLADTPLRISKPQGTYLMWLDCRALGFAEEALMDFFKHKAKLYLIGGPAFGAGGEGFARMNIGLPRPLLKQAMQQLKGPRRQRRCVCRCRG